MSPCTWRERESERASERASEVGRDGGGGEGGEREFIRNDTLRTGVPMRASPIRLLDPESSSNKIFK
jgi:hypothetical protein